VNGQKIKDGYVIRLQSWLAELDYLKPFNTNQAEKADGAFGNKTVQAVQDFQTESGLPAKGIVGGTGGDFKVHLHYEVLINPPCGQRDNGGYYLTSVTEDSAKGISHSMNPWLFLP
jgi:peptidoglycan hydrolase-like protein with peptidoglycan-binding domain